jgi:hypothetical protein
MPIEALHACHQESSACRGPLPACHQTYHRSPGVAVFGEPCPVCGYTKPSTCPVCQNIRWLDDRGYPDVGQPAFAFQPCPECNYDGTLSRPVEGPHG